MGLELAEHSPAARALLDLAGEESGVDVLGLLRRGGPDWNRTAIIQPLLVAVTLGVLGELTKAGITAKAVAGHSLGEIGACCAAGCLDPPAAIALAATRGRLMAREAAEHPGGMIALLEGDERRATEAATRGAAHGPLVVAGCNGPDQWVLSGALPALRSVAATHRCRWLPAAGAWHSSAMAGAVDELRELLRAGIRAPDQAPFVSAANGQVVTSAEQVTELLAGQLVQPFRWDRTLATLRDMGIEHVVTLGPAKVLRGLVRSNLGSAVTVHQADRPTDLVRVIEQVGP